MNRQVFLLNDYGILGIKGKDAAKFLQGQFSCDVSQIDKNSSSFGVQCDPKGRILSLFQLFQKEDYYCLLMPKESLENTKASLDKYRLFYKSQIENLTQTWSIVGIMDSRNEIGTALPQPGKPDSIILIDSDIPSTHSDNTAWHVHRIQSKLPYIYPDTVGQFLPQKLDLTNLGAINFKKGCYTGQEIIARMHYLGKPKTSFCYFTVKKPSALKRGQSILDENHKNVGELVDFVLDKNQCAHALGSILKTALGANLFIGEFPIQVVNCSKE